LKFTHPTVKTIVFLAIMLTVMLALGYLLLYPAYVTEVRYAEDGRHIYKKEMAAKKSCICLITKQKPRRVS